MASNDSEMIRSACGVIHALGPAGDEFAKPMLKLLKDGDAHDRHAALYSIQAMSPEEIVGSIDDVIAELDDGNFNTQCSACFVLTNLGRSASPATERLVRLLAEGNVSTRSRAAQALGAIGPVEGFDVPALLAERLDAFSHEEKVRVLGALGGLGPDALDHIEKVEMLMETPNLNCQAEAALAYYRITGDPDRSLKKMLVLLNQTDNKVAVVESLGGMEEAAADAVPQLTEILFHNDPAYCETAILSLKRIGRPAASALPRLNKLLDHEDFFITVAAREAIEAISGTKPE